MISKDSDAQMPADLAALSAAANSGCIPGSRVVIPVPAAEEIGDETRAARVAELKAKYDAGTLGVDEKDLASRMVDLLLRGSEEA